MLTTATITGSISVVDTLTQVAIWAFLASAGLALGSLLSRPSVRQFEGKSYGEIVKFNPPAAFYTAYGRLLPFFLRALLVTGTSLAAALAVRTLA